MVYCFKCHFWPLITKPSILATIQPSQELERIFQVKMHRSAICDVLAVETQAQNPSTSSGEESNACYCCLVFSAGGRSELVGWSFNEKSIN